MSAFVEHSIHAAVRIAPVFELVFQSHREEQERAAAIAGIGDFDRRLRLAYLQIEDAKDDPLNEGEALRNAYEYRDKHFSAILQLVAYHETLEPLRARIRPLLCQKTVDDLVIQRTLRRIDPELLIDAAKLCSKKMANKTCKISISHIRRCVRHGRGMSRALFVALCEALRTLGESINTFPEALARIIVSRDAMSAVEYDLLAMRTPPVDLNVSAEELSLEETATIFALFAMWPTLAEWLEFGIRAKGNLGSICFDRSFCEFTARLLAQAAAALRGMDYAETVLMSLAMTDPVERVIWIARVWNRWQEAGYFVSQGFLR